VGKGFLGDSLLFPAPIEEDVEGDEDGEGGIEWEIAANGKANTSVST